jgi:hypothetical protein
VSVTTKCIVTPSAERCTLPGLHQAAEAEGARGRRLVRAHVARAVEEHQVAVEGIGTSVTPRAPWQTRWQPRQQPAASRCHGRSSGAQRVQSRSSSIAAAALQGQHHRLPAQRRGVIPNEPHTYSA